MLIAVIIVFLNGLFSVLKAKGIMHVKWKDGIDIPRAKKKLLVGGWIQMILFALLVIIQFI